MQQLMSLPASSYTLWEYPCMDSACKSCGCDGLEIIWGREEMPENIPQGLHIGYHLTFFPDWLDFWLDDEDALIRKFGSRKEYTDFYGGANGREVLLNAYREDLQRAADWGAQYVVYHVSDVSLEEGFSYCWEHSHRQVIEEAAKLINLALSGMACDFTLLVENQWWPGFTFTNPAETELLLGLLEYPSKGIMLDTGHLLNANQNLKTQQEAAAFIHQMLDKHGELSSYIKGIHLHQSLSGEYSKKACGENKIPADWNTYEDYISKFHTNYKHILKIDRHEPWTDDSIASVVQRINPEYLVHELSASSKALRDERIRIQQRAIGRL